MRNDYYRRCSWLRMHASRAQSYIQVPGHCLNATPQRFVRAWSPSGLCIAIIQRLDTTLDYKVADTPRAGRPVRLVRVLMNVLHADSCTGLRDSNATKHRTPCRSVRLSPRLLVVIELHYAGNGLP